MMTYNPLFSIITVCFRSSKTIERTFLSVLEQSFTNYEYIVIDGGSDDGTVDVIKEYETLFKNKGIVFRWISEPDKGIYDAMNKGIKMANGEYIALLNSDDSYECDALKNVSEAIGNNPGYDVYHGLLRIWKGDSVIKIIGSEISVLKERMIEHPTCFISNKAYSNYGLYSLKFKLASDYDLIARMKSLGARFFLIENILTNYGLDGLGHGYVSELEALTIRKNNHYISCSEYFIKRLKIELKHLYEKL